jgi:hypothetical protein
LEHDRNNADQIDKQTCETVVGADIDSPSIRSRP